MKNMRIDSAEYRSWLRKLCTEIDKQRLHAVMQVNAATLQHYWWMGSDILHEQKTYPDFPFVQVPLAQLEGDAILQARFAKFTVSADGMYVQVPLAQITWYHHISLFSKVKEVALRAFYITETARQGWSRDVMLLQIESDYHKMVDSLPNNFDATLPPVHSDLARDAFKDPYNLGFVDMAKVKAN